jgi:hypothetical protein
MYSEDIFDEFAELLSSYSDKDSTTFFDIYPEDPENPDIQPLHYKHSEPSQGRKRLNDIIQSAFWGYLWSTAIQGGI